MSAARSTPGSLTISEAAVAKVANYAASQVPGIAAMGRPGLLRNLVRGPTQGVAAEVGEQQAALDLFVIVEFGIDLREAAAEVRQRVADAVLLMAGRRVVEVNIAVTGIRLPEATEEQPAPRVL